jgi:cobalt/nickel transport system permease protein
MLYRISPKSAYFGLLAGGALIVLILAPLASSAPDGLEYALASLGLGELASAPHSSPLPDYAVPGIKNESTSTSLAGLLGLTLVFAIGSAISYFLRPKSPVKSGSATNEAASSAEDAIV